MIDKAVIELEKKLPYLKKYSYSSIDDLMRKIMKKYDITAKQLHNAFVGKHHQTPDTWIKKKTFKEFRENLNEL